MSAAVSSLVFQGLLVLLVVTHVQSQSQLSFAQNAQTISDLQYVLGANYKMFVAAYWRYMYGGCDPLATKLSTDIANGYLKSYCTYLTQCPVVSSSQSCIVQQSATAVRRACCKESTCSYGLAFPSEKIIGGQPAVIGEFPWTAMLLLDGRLICACVILDDRHAITAAHCLSRLVGGEIIEVLAGRYQYNLTLKEEGNQRVKVTSYKQHEVYDYRYLYNDVAMLTLSTPLLFTAFVTPACLPPRGDNPELSCTVAGWGTISSRLILAPQVLMKVKLQTYNKTECFNTFKDTSQPQGSLGLYLTDGNLCAANGLLGGQDSCSGDSGGPLMCLKKSSDNVLRYYVFGIVSGASDCARPGEPGLYSNLLYYMDWIETNLRSS
ncbi:trypsin-1 [Biomphalaria pfeifferi]|uniref:Trypsin-1 n=1 Tax=Biomphalaria pfeifferi TaxID=112525 RepID=A0AAD8BYU6_BIOPF|nr:trypsin-1 [Biomphalaria pfeifferi]